ncbi:MAG: LemA family protein [Candidatus Omnitrophota bacterium]
MKKFWIVLLVVVVIALMFGSWFISGLNRIVVLDENVNQAWAQVENQLQRRNDLIPNLVSTVKGYMTYEQETFTKITELRSQWAKAQTTEEKINVAGEMGGVLSRLLVVAENYPELKANQNFLSLQAQLEGTENRIAVERMRYNNGVRAFNAYQRTVFGKFFADRRGLTEPRVYFEIEEKAKELPKVEF